MSLAVVTSFFNFAGFKRPQSNLQRFLRQMTRDGVAVYGVELSVDGNFATVGKPNWQQFVIDPRTQTLWQKEAALNVAAKSLPMEVTAIAWVDADVWFTNPNWAEDTLQALKWHDIVQMFETCHWVDESGTVVQSLSSCGKIPITPEGKSHSGFAWAMRRSLWDKAGGLFPFALSGGGDSLMAATFQRVDFWDRVRLHFGRSLVPFLRWASAFESVSTGFVAGQLYHEWHGTARNRDYYGRAERLSEVSAEHHLEFDKRGLLRWTNEAPAAIVKAAAEYFPSRKEDGTPL